MPTRVDILLDSSSSSSSPPSTPPPPRCIDDDVVLSPTLQHGGVSPCSVGRRSHRRSHSSSQPVPQPHYVAEEEDADKGVCHDATDSDEHLPLLQLLVDPLPTTAHPPIGSKRARDDGIDEGDEAATSNTSVANTNHHPQQRTSTATSATTPEAPLIPPSHTNSSHRGSSPQHQLPPSTTTTTTTTSTNAHRLSQLSSQHEGNNNNSGNTAPVTATSTTITPTSANTPPLSPRSQFVVLRNIMSSPAARKCSRLPSIELPQSTTTPAAPGICMSSVKPASPPRTTASPPQVVARVVMCVSESPDNLPTEVPPPIPTTVDGLGGAAENDDGNDVDGASVDNGDAGEADIDDTPTESQVIDIIGADVPVKVPVDLVDRSCEPMTPQPPPSPATPTPPPTTRVDMEVQCQLIGDPLPLWGAETTTTAATTTTTTTATTTSCTNAVDVEGESTPTNRRLPSVSSPDTAPSPARRLTVGSEVEQSIIRPVMCPPPDQMASSSNGSPCLAITRQSTTAFHSSTIHPQDSSEQQHSVAVVPADDRRGSGGALPPHIHPSSASSSGDKFDFGSSGADGSQVSSRYADSANSRRQVSSIADRSTTSHVSASRSPAKPPQFSGSGSGPIPRVHSNDGSEGSSGKFTVGGVGDNESPHCQRQLIFSSTAGTSGGEGTSSTSQGSPGLDTQIANALDALGIDDGGGTDPTTNNLFRMTGVSSPKPSNRFDLFDSQLSNATSGGDSQQHHDGSSERGGGSILGSSTAVVVANGCIPPHPTTTAAVVAVPYTSVKDIFDRNMEHLSKGHPTRPLDSQHVVFDDGGW